VSGDEVTVSWSGSMDGQTPSPGLSYNLRVGTSPLGQEVMTAMADPATGWRRVVGAGNAQHRLSWRLQLTRGGPHYWSVQAVDGAGAGSAFAAEGSFTSTVDVADAASARVYFVLATANPALGPARFRFGLPVAGRVQLSVYDLRAVVWQRWWTGISRRVTTWRRGVRTAPGAPVRRGCTSRASSWAGTPSRAGSSCSGDGRR
jgi:hypothetical protein